MRGRGATESDVFSTCVASRLHWKKGKRYDGPLSTQNAVLAVVVSVVLIVFPHGR